MFSSCQFVGRRPCDTLCGACRLSLFRAGFIPCKDNNILLSYLFKLYEICFFYLFLGVWQRYAKLLATARRNVEHRVHHYRLADRAQTACAELVDDGAVDDVVENFVVEGELHAVHLEQPDVLFHDGVLRLGQDRAQRLAAERLHVGQHRQAPDQFGDQAERFEILRHDVLHQVRTVDRVGSRAAVAHRPRVEPLGDLALDAVERTSADEEDVARVDLYEFLVGMLAPALRRYVDRRPFENFQQRLLHPFARYVARDRNIFALPRDFIDLIDVNDAALCALDVKVRRLQELEEDIQPALEICAELEGLQRRIAQNGSDTEKRRLQLGSLLPWADMTDPLEKVHSTASIKVMTGTVPAEGVKALMETGALVQLYGGEKERAALVICPNEEYAGIAPSIRATGFQEKGFGDIRGTASENIQRLRTEIEALEAERAQLEARLAAFAPKREEIRRALDGAAIDRDREQSKEALAHTNTAFLLTGWVREDMTEKVRREIEKITDVYYLVFEDPSEGDAVPTVLKNSRLITPYEAVTNLYSLPAYGTIDGTPLMAPFYFIFFCMMLSDSVYGAVLALGAWAFLKYLKPTGMMKNLAGVLMQGGISTIFMGLLFGTCAGVGWPVIFRGTALENTFPLIDSSTNPMGMLMVCAAFGIIHMFYAVLIATWNCLKHKDYMGALIDNMCWIFIVSGLIIKTPLDHFIHPPFRAHKKAF